MTQCFLVSTQHHLLLFDGSDSFFRVHSGKGLYYGLAQDGHEIYVACRNQTGVPDDEAARAGEVGSILVFDSASLAPLGEIRPEHFPLRDVHGISCFDGKVWVTSSFDNLIAVFDLGDRSWTKWYPSVDHASRDRDVNHFNTIVPDGERILVVAHNNGLSHLLSYDRITLDLCSVRALGRQAHDIFPIDGGIGTCSSFDGTLVSTTGWTLRTGSFPRGIAFGDDGILVGLSKVAHRSMRHEMPGTLRLFTPQWRHAADFVLPGVGMVLTILPVELERGAWDALEPFEAQSFHGEYNPEEPGNVYRVGACDKSVFEPEWHAGERSHRWTAAREARMTLIVNPGETCLGVCASNSFPGVYWAEVLLNGESLGALRWMQPGRTSFRFTLPEGTLGASELTFRVPHLWQPSALLGSDDRRTLGVSIRELCIF